MSDGADSTGLERCANCDTRLDVPERWYPTTARRVEEGLELLASVMRRVETVPRRGVSG